MRLCSFCTYVIGDQKNNNFSKTTHSVNDLIKIAVLGCDLHKSNQRKGLPWWLSGKESSCNAGHKRYKFNPWIRKIPWKKAWQPTPVFLPGESYGQRSWQAPVHWVTKGQTCLKLLSTHVHTHTCNQRKRGGKAFKCEIALSCFLFNDFFPPILSSLLLLRTLLAVQEY